MMTRTGEEVGLRWGLVAMAITVSLGIFHRAIDAAEPVSLTAEELLVRSEARFGKIYLIKPSPDEMRHKDGRPAETVMQFFPEGAGQSLKVTLPVPADGYYRLTGTHVYGSYSQGRYGRYQATADGVPLPGKVQGWSHASGPPADWPKAKAHLIDINWGVIFLRTPSVRLVFTPPDGGGLLGTERLSLTAVNEQSLKAEDKSRQVPEQPSNAGETTPTTTLSSARTAAETSNLKGAVTPEFGVTQSRTDAAQGVRWVGSDSRFMEDITRYDAPRGDRLPSTQLPVTRQSYLDYIGKDSQYGAEAICAKPDHGNYGVRHAFPALAQYAAMGEKRYAEGIKKCIHFYDTAIRKQVAEEGCHKAYMHDPTLLCMFRKVFQEHGDWSAEDEAWFRNFFPWMNRTVHVWGGSQTFWRGPMHRATGEGIMKLLAATMYPDLPEAADWRRYAVIQWNDWWRFRDNPINDINYFQGQIFPVVLGAHLLGRKEVFTDPGMRKFWDRLVDMTTPDGAIVPFGPAAGWNSHAGERLMALEVAAAYTGDGRYRFVAHRIFNYLLYQNDVVRKNHMSDHFSQLGCAVAYFIADDTIKPVPPSPGSAILYHKETLRVKGKQGAANYLPDLDPDPLKANIDCGLLCTDKEVPFKLCLRSGWNPGDMYMLVDIFPGHDPRNPGGVLGMSYHNSALTHGAQGSKDLTDWLNMFQVQDLSGMATAITNPNPNTVDAYSMDVTVPGFSEHKAVTYAKVRIKDYQGYPMTLEREFFFAKNRFCVVRDTAEFRESFLARLGPNWLTQNVGTQIGGHWANTYLSAPYGYGQFLHATPMDLLVYHAPHAERQLVISDETADARRLSMPYTLRYVWQGVVQPGQKYCFAHLLMPGVPTRKPLSGTMRVSLEEIAGKYMAAGVTVLADDAEKSVWRIRSEKDHEEWVVLNGEGKLVDIEGLKTDARQLYLDLRQGKVQRVLLLDGTCASVAGREIYTTAKRRDFEK